MHWEPHGTHKPHHNPTPTSILNLPVNMSTRPNRISNQESNSRNSRGGNYRLDWYQAMVIKKNLFSPAGKSGMTRASKIGIRHNKISADAQDAWDLSNTIMLKLKRKTQSVGVTCRGTASFVLNSTRAECTTRKQFLSSPWILSHNRRWRRFLGTLHCPTLGLHAQFHMRKIITLNINFTHASTQTS